MEMMFDVRKNLNLTISSDALKNYELEFEKALSLDKSIAVFLDTNVLLSYYGMAASEKEKLLSFLKVNKDHIFLTAQVQEEFRKNRIKIIESDLFKPLRNIPSSLRKASNEVCGKFQSFMDDHKKLLGSDYKDEWNRLLEVQVKLKEIADIGEIATRLEEQVESTTKDYKDVKIVDDLLKVCSSLQMVDKLGEDRINDIKMLYDELIADYKNPKNSNLINSVFPGAGDHGKKEYPYGDFIIYHEILCFVKENDRNAVFLTNEKSKGDWIADNFTPHVHYIEHTYNLTNRIIYIINAETPLRLSLENIHSNISEELRYRESIVHTINHEKGFGFIYHDGDTYYFNISSFNDKDDFCSLNKQDYLRFTLDENGDNIVATNCSKPVYSFSNDECEFHSAKIVSIKDRYGFITGDEGNLYFHRLTVNECTNFNDLKAGDEVEYIEGINFDGDKLVRRLRRKI